MPHDVPLRHGALERNEHLQADVSTMVSAGLTFVFVALALASLVRAARYKASERSERAHDEPGAPPPEGPCVVSGRVAYRGDEGLAVRVEIDQDGSESESSGTWSHRWVETDRRALVRPFDLVLDDGRRLVVEPPSDVSFVDDLDKKILVNKTKRVLVAELVPGERVWIRGELVRRRGTRAGYRGGEAELVLQKPKRGRMEISSEPLAERFRQRAAYHARIARSTLAVMLVLEATLATHYARLFFGHVEWRTVRNKFHDVKRDSDGDEHTWGVKIELVPGTIEAVVIDERDWRAGLEEGDLVPVRVVPSWPFASALGAGSTIHAGHAFMLGVVLVGSLIGRGVDRRRTRPWYRRKAEHSHGGRLPEVAPGAPREELFLEKLDGA